MCSDVREYLYNLAVWLYELKTHVNSKPNTTLVILHIHAGTVLSNSCRLVAQSTAQGHFTKGTCRVMSTQNLSVLQIGSAYNLQESDSGCALGFTVRESFRWQEKRFGPR